MCPSVHVSLSTVPGASNTCETSQPLPHLESAMVLLTGPSRKKCWRNGQLRLSGTCPQQICRPVMDLTTSKDGQWKHYEWKKYWVGDRLHWTLTTSQGCQMILSAQETWPLLHRRHPKRVCSEQQLSRVDRDPSFCRHPK